MKVILKQKDARAAGVFLIKFNLLALPLYIVLALNFDFYALEKATASVVFYLLQALGFNPSISGIMITIPVQNGTWAAFINSACTGWKSAYLFFALVMATPLKKKAVAMIFIPLIFLINIIRIIFMFWVAQQSIEYFDIAHALVWSWGMALLVLFLWLFWMRNQKFFSRIAGVRT